MANSSKMADRSRKTAKNIKIAYFEVEDWERDRLTRGLESHEIVFFPGPLEEQLLPQIADASVISVFIRSQVNRRAIEALPRLGLVATRSTGFDHIDLDACAGRGILVANVPYYGETTVAEHAFGLMLSLSRKIHKAYLRTLQGSFSLEGLRGFDLHGKTLGVVGAGHIGLHAIRIAKGFGMKVLAFDVQQDRLIAEVLGFEYVPLEELLRQSDIISLHAPLNASTYHMIDREKLKLAKRGALLINTARGGLVDTDALIWALDEGILSGAGLDVIEGEELVEEEKQLLRAPQAEEKLRMLLRQHVLLRREDVVVTPHIAFDSWEALERIVDTTTANIRAFLAGTPQNVVNPTAIKPKVERAA
ncbi:MAG: hydroxyacid dehydrogenase [Chloroflexota bacterium]